MFHTHTQDLPILNIGPSKVSQALVKGSFTHPSPSVPGTPVGGGSARSRGSGGAGAYSHCIGPCGFYQGRGTILFGRLHMKDSVP